ncbi:hypothetical protein PRIPAC_96221 [Pristionchus pacificus]|uniref:Uncharacterized protein n=1 Tax=Pristionchus pacificus TaxID=54126 RepID=A0A2A6CUS2_PRIPA|nr:hypothetical protein PRIPAC_96221 [Pristionchus pacificus]|eukprot:PDM81793.1 hypothetical protein PRIPAC_33947 [Pristionchus pacificus]
MNGRIPMIVEHGTECLKVMQQLMWLSEMSMTDEEFVKYKKLFTMEQEPPHSFSPLSLVYLETFLYVIGGLLLCSIATFLLEIVVHRTGVLKRAFKRISRTSLLQAFFPHGL